MEARILQPRPQRRRRSIVSPLRSLVTLVLLVRYVVLTNEGFKIGEKRRVMEESVVGKGRGFAPAGLVTVTGPIIGCSADHTRLRRPRHPSYLFYNCDYCLWSDICRCQSPSSRPAASLLVAPAPYCQRPPSLPLLLPLLLLLLLWLLPSVLIPKQRAMSKLL